MLIFAGDEADLIGLWVFGRRKWTWFATNKRMNPAHKLIEG